MLSVAPDSRTLEIALRGLYDRQNKLGLLAQLVRELFVADKFQELPSYINSLYAQSEHDINALLAAHQPTSAQPATKEDVTEIIKEETAPIKKTLAKVDATTTTINNRDKKYRRKSKQNFTIEQQDGIDNTWQIAKKDSAVKALAKGKSDYTSAFIQFRRQFEAHGAKSVKDIGRALRARSERIARMARRK